MTSKQRHSDVPTSLEAVRSKILGVVHAVERETKEFSTIHLKPTAEESSKILDYLRRVKSLAEAASLVQMGERVMMLTERDQDTAVLKRAVEREMSFGYIATYLYPELYNVYHRYLSRFCLSLERETGQLGLNPVIDYENKIIGWKEDLNDRMRAVEKILREKSSYDRAPVQNYVIELGRIRKMMTDVCQSMNEACEVMKVWVMTDYAYSHRLHDEIDQCNIRRAEIKKSLRLFEGQLDRQKVQVTRQEFSSGQATLILQKAKRDRTESNRRLDVLRRQYKANSDKLKGLRQQLSELKSRLDGPIPRLEIREKLDNDAHIVRGKIRDTEEASETMKFQMRSILASQEGREKDARGKAEELKNNSSSSQKTKDEIENLDISARGLREELAQLGTKASALKRIYDAKTSPETVKQLYLVGYNPGMTATETDEGGNDGSRGL